ncbi:hypothetical protein [Undibacterium sp. JH2W]|uniref:hypothetical protein n=1 Tax=Undibacterium sp. JH2W TaxID=3413037 RepID=UPI003BF4ECC6
MNWAPMHIPGMVALLSGIAILVLLQLYSAIMIFASNHVQALLCLVVPGYLLLWAMRYIDDGKFLLVYFSGVALVVLGAVILS